MTRPSKVLAAGRQGWSFFLERAAAKMIYYGCRQEHKLSAEGRTP
jgi:hypothetical protein